MPLNLDARQRAMLQDMGICAWWPEATAPADAIPAPFPTVAAAPAASTPVEPPPSASNLLAENSGSTRAEGAFLGVIVPAQEGAVAHMDWPTLQASVSHCRRCGLCEGRTQTVFGVGQPPATPETAPRVDWLIVGEAPGETEDLQGEPFVGAAGKLLDNMLAAMQLSRHRNVYIANVLKCRPPGNRNPTPEEVAACAPHLHRQIELLQPKVILAMGRFAINTLLADSVADAAAQPVGRLRGQVHRYRQWPVVVSYHPAYLLRNLPEKSKAWADLCLALAVHRQAAPAAPTHPLAP